MSPTEFRKALVYGFLGSVGRARRPLRRYEVTKFWRAAGAAPRVGARPWRQASRLERGGRGNPQGGPELERVVGAGLARGRDLDQQRRLPGGVGLDGRLLIQRLEALGVRDQAPGRLLGTLREGDGA